MDKHFCLTVLCVTRNYTEIATGVMIAIGFCNRLVFYAVADSLTLFLQRNMNFETSTATQISSYFSSVVVLTRV